MKIPSKKQFFGECVYNLYALPVSLRRYDFVVKVIRIGRREEKNHLVWKKRISHVPENCNQILSCFTPFPTRIAFRAMVLNLWAMAHWWATEIFEKFLNL